MYKLIQEKGPMALFEIPEEQRTVEICVEALKDSVYLGWIKVPKAIYQTVVDQVRESRKGGSYA